MKIQLRLFQELMLARRAGDKEDPGLLARFLQTPVPTAAAWANRGRSDVVKTEGARLDSLIKSLIEKHGGKAASSVPGGSMILFQFPPDKIPEFREDEAELLDQEVELPGIAVKVSDLPAGASFSGADLDLLSRAGLVVE